MSVRIAQQRGTRRVLAIDLVPERLERARAHGVETLDLTQYNGDLPEAVREMTGGRGPDAVIDAVGMEAHGAAVGKLAQKIAPHAYKIFQRKEDNAFKVLVKP